MKQEEYPEEIKAILKFGKRRKPGQYEDDDANATIPLDLVAVESPVKSCEDCGAVVQDRRINIKKLTQPIACWRKVCSVCKQCEHPITKEYSLNSVELTQLLRTIHNPNSANLDLKNNNIDK